jgi:hypothetical protein
MALLLRTAVVVVEVFLLTAVERLPVLAVPVVAVQAERLLLLMA